MTVQELRDLLSNFPDDMPVEVWVGAYGEAAHKPSFDLEATLIQSGGLSAPIISVRDERALGYYSVCLSNEKD